jgi:hypothetical protein
MRKKQELPPEKEMVRDEEKFYRLRMGKNGDFAILS